jgi:hypothetical protein
MINSVGVEKLANPVASFISGERILDHVREIARYDRALGSTEYHEAAQYVLRCLGRMGLRTSTLEVPLDGKTMPGNWVFPRAWEPRGAIFRITSPEERTLVTFQEHPVCLHSWSAATSPEGEEAELVYVGDGTRDEDYAGVDVRGKIVFADKGANWLVYTLAIEKYGALGYVSDDILEIPGLKTRERFPEMLLWYTFYEQGSDGKPLRGWGFSISPRQGDYLRHLLRQGPVKAFARVQARTFEGVMENPVGVLEGSKYPEEEVVLMAHLCHPRPSAMDNAAGCGILLEAANTIARLVQEGKIERPKRSIVFLFGPEGHVSNAYPAAKRDHLDDIIAALAVDTVGATPAVAGGPLLLGRASAATPSFINDLGERLLKRAARQYPAFGGPPSLGEAAGDLGRGASAFKFDVAPYGMHTDCMCGWGVPTVSLVQWPAIFWHTQYDTPDRLDAVELQRVAWVTAMMALMVADAALPEALSLMYDVERGAERNLHKLGAQTRQELLAADQNELYEILGRRQDQLRFAREMGGRAVASASVLVRRDSKDARNLVEEVNQKLDKRLVDQERAEAKSLAAFVQQMGAGRDDSLGIQGAPLAADEPGVESASEDAATRLAQKAERRPKMKRPGLINMKFLAIELGRRYSGRDPLYMDHLAEMTNLSNGQRSIGEIARIIDYEIGTIDLDTTVAMFEDLESLGFLTFA